MHFSPYRGSQGHTKIGAKIISPSRIFPTPEPWVPDPEEQTRGDLYALCSRLLLLPPDTALLAALAAARPVQCGAGTSRMEQAWESLGAAAQALQADVVREEFDALFISLGTPLLNPYASFYLSGFILEKPLAALRDDLRALGLARRRERGETEDHLGLLCETMRVLILGIAATDRPVPARPVAVQRRFFERHLAPWYEICLHDIRDATPANFYRVTANFMLTFLDIESRAFAMDEEVQASPPTTRK